MSDFLLSQAEIDALMEQNKMSHSAFDQELTEFFQPVNSVIEKQLHYLFGSPVSVDGFYIEKLINFSDDITDNAYMFPTEFKLGDTYLMITEADAEVIAKHFNVSIMKALTVVVEEFAAILSEFLTEKTDYWQRPYVYQPVLMETSQIKSLPVGPSHRARFNICLNSKGIELFWFLSDNVIQEILTRKVAKEYRRRENDQKTMSIQKPKSVKVEPFRFKSLDSDIKESVNDHQFELVSDVNIEITAELGQSTMTLGDIMTLKVGDFIKLDKSAGEPADVFAMGQPIAKAEVTIVDEHFGLRVLAIDSMKDLIIY